MDIYKRVENLEKLVNKLIETINNNKFYHDADIVGVRESVGSIDSTLHPDWDGDGYDYFAGERVRYNNAFWRCIQSHRSQSDWTPDMAVSLWVEIADPADEWPEWKQPAGAHDAYTKGSKVSHLEKHWISTIDANVYEPGVYGWDEQ